MAIERLKLYKYDIRGRLYDNGLVGAVMQKAYVLLYYFISF